MHVVSKIALVALALVGGAVAGDGESLNPTEQQQLASSTKGGEKEAQPGEQVVQDKTETEKKHVTWQHFESADGHPDNAVCYQIDLHAQAAHEQQKKKTGTDQHTTGHDQSQKKTDQQKAHHDQQTGTQFLEQDGDQQKPGTDQNKEQKTGTDQNKVSGDQHTTEENTEKVCWLCHSTTAKEQSAGTSDGATSQFLELLSGGVTCEDIAKRASAGEHFHCVQTELQETTGVDKLATPSPCKHHHVAVVDQQNKDQQNKEQNKDQKVEGDGVHKEHKDGAHKDQDVADDDNNEQATEQLPSNN